jgi:hypothetical protein
MPLGFFLGSLARRLGASAQQTAFLPCAAPMAESWCANELPWRRGYPRRVSRGQVVVPQRRRCPIGSATEDADAGQPLDQASFVERPRIEAV